jgi:DNA-binding GntR family transcriptional regulator
VVWLKEHLDIMEAMVAGDLLEASRLMRTHLTNAMHSRSESTPKPTP